MTQSKPKVEPDSRYSMTEAAKLLGVERHTVYRYMQNGSLKYRVRKSDNRKVTTGQWIIDCWEEMYL